MKDCTVYFLQCQYHFGFQGSNIIVRMDEVAVKFNYSILINENKGSGWCRKEDGTTNNPISITGAKMLVFSYLLKNGYELSQLV